MATIKLTCRTCSAQALVSSPRAGRVGIAMAATFALEHGWVVRDDGDVFCGHDCAALAAKDVTPYADRPERVN